MTLQKEIIPTALTLEKRKVTRRRVIEIVPNDYICSHANYQEI